MPPRVAPPPSNPQSTIRSQDCFYRPLSAADRELAYRQDYNFDHPNAFDFDHQIDVLTELRAGSSSVAIPTYDFTTHSRLPPEHDTHVEAPQIIIFEGILALFDERMRDLFDLKVFSSY